MPSNLLEVIKDAGDEYTFLRMGEKRELMISEGQDIVYYDFPSHVAVLTVEDLKSEKWYLGRYLKGSKK